MPMPLDGHGPNRRRPGGSPTAWGRTGGCAKCVLSIEGGGEEEGYFVSQREGFLAESFF